MSKTTPKIFNEDYLLELLNRDGAIHLDSPATLNGGITIHFECRCTSDVQKLFRDIAYYGGAFCKECVKKNTAMKIKETCVKRYSVINPSCIQEIKDKKEETSIKNYGMHPKKTEGVQAKYRQTCLERYNTDNTAKTIEVRDKIKETFIKKYGGHPMHNDIIKGKVRDTCLERYGCHPAQRLEIQEQIQKSGKTYKCYTMPSGEVRQIQGYEHFALDILVKEYTEEQIKSNRRDVPRILYKSNNKQRYYFPDIYLSHMNLIIEVKSTWIYKKKKKIIISKRQQLVHKGINLNFGSLLIKGYVFNNNKYYRIFSKQ